MFYHIDLIWTVVADCPLATDGPVGRKGLIRRVSAFSWSHGQQFARAKLRSSQCDALRDYPRLTPI